MNYKIVKLDFCSNLTVYPESYTVFGGICWMYSLIFGKEKLKEIIGQFKNGNPPFLISSIFPIKEEKFFLPRPIVNFEIPDNYDFSKLKKIKSKEYIDSESFKNILECIEKNNYENILNLLEKANSVSAKTFSQPHVNLDKIAYTSKEAGNLFFENYLAFTSGYFFIKINKGNIYNDLEKCLYKLEEFGFGGNKSTGMGKFKIKWIKEIENTDLNYLFSQENSKKVITLSPVILQSLDNINLKESFYQVYPFRGVFENYFSPIDENIWKQKVFYLKSGSLLTKVSNNMIGFCPEVLQVNNSSIIQYGYEFPIYLKE